MPEASLPFIAEVHRGPRRRRLIAVIALAAVAGAGVAMWRSRADADDYVSSPAVKMWESKGSVTEGEVTIAGEPSAIYATVTDYRTWTAIFPNLKTVTIKSGGPIAATIETLSYKGKRHTLVFKNDPATRTVRFEERGGRASVKGEITFSAGRRRGETVVHARLYADVGGAAGLFVSDGKVRGKRRKKVMGDLTRMLAYFGPPPVVR